MGKILLIDDEDIFRNNLQKRLKLRGFDVIALNSGNDAVKTVKGAPDIDVVILDKKMPGMSGEEVLREIRAFRPAIQAIFLTGHGSISSAMEAGKLEAFAYLEKPCDFEHLVEVIEKAKSEIVRVMEKHEIPMVESGSFKKWLMGSHNSRPGMIILGLLLFFGIVLMPTPDRMEGLLSAAKTGSTSDLHSGYAYYSKM